MPPRSQRLDLRVILPVLCCALFALLPAPTTHAQSPAAASPSAPATPAAKPLTPAAAPAPAPASIKATAAQPPVPSAVKEAAPPASLSKAPLPLIKKDPPAPPTPPASLFRAPQSPAKKEAAATPKAPATAPGKTAPPAPKPAIAAAPSTVAALTPADEVRRTFKDKITPFIKTYCFECHGDRRMKGGVNFAPALKNPSDPAHTRRWKLGLATVNAHDMPPDDADKQPTDAEREEFMSWVGRLKYLSPQDPGAFVIRRLTKTEYGNTLHDLLGVEPSIVAELPDEVPGEGYLNTLSPLQMEQYLGIANKALSRLPSGGMSPIPPFQELRRFSPSTTRPADYRAEARQLAQKIARHAYRRPATPQEIDVLLQVYDLATQNKLPPEAGLELMLKAALVSPQFLYITPASTTSNSNSTTAGQGTPPTPAPEILPLDDWMLASRLSYFLWATMPDGELSTLADQGKLHDPAVLSAQVARMLKDDRSRALFDGFGAQWLGLADLADKTFDTTKFPQMTPALRQAMYDEARLFFSSIIRDNAPVSTFITADYTYLNAPLAALYGPAQPSGIIDFTIPPLQPTSKKGFFKRLFDNKKEGAKPSSAPPTTTPAAAPAPTSAPTTAPSKSTASSSSAPVAAAPPSAPPPTPAPPAQAPASHSLAKNSAPASPTPTARALTSGGEANLRPLEIGTGFHRVQLKDPNRGGILGMPGILAVTSFPNRTSPVKRGVWVLEQILGQHVPPAPPNVPTLEKQDKKKIANLTLRQRTELHRTNVVCANCHKILDPIGFGLENFDAIGRWRAQDDTGGPIDAAGELPGGKHFSTPAELKSIIAARKDDLTRNLTEKLLAYALCRQLEGYDEIIIDQLMTGIAKDNHRMQTLITSVITSYPFLNRRIVETLSATPAAAVAKPTSAPAAKPKPAPAPTSAPATKSEPAAKLAPAPATAPQSAPPPAAPAKK